jgi:PhzF family phenazine biosynthesis protein
VPLSLVVAIADHPFVGDPEAVVPLSEWQDHATRKAIAAERNLSETALLGREGAGWQLCWFPPTTEVALCGHATRATALVRKTERGHGRARDLSRQPPDHVETIIRGRGEDLARAKRRLDRSRL